ncbi:MAG TPA: DUF2889 domain-containing protein [Stellaceae bacterium]|jgi:hypothetical protein|nr:DUF2889 domain-containing protein [Stellaceae bacterium]
MPLSSAAPHKLIHTRQVECRGYHRDDGLWDIEGHLTDIKTYPFESESRGTVEPGDPVHEMWIRLTVDDSLIVQSIEAVTDKSPFPVCSAITPNFQRVVGLSIRPGFLSRLRERLGGVEGCTHLVELMGPIATTAYQTIYPYRNRMKREAAPQKEARPTERPRLIDTCHALKSDGDVVRRLWPEFYTGDVKG